MSYDTEFKHILHTEDSTSIWKETFQGHVKPSVSSGTTWKIMGGRSGSFSRKNLAGERVEGIEWLLRNKRQTIFCLYVQCSWSFEVTIFGMSTTKIEHQIEDIELYYPMDILVHYVENMSHGPLVEKSIRKRQEG